MRPSLWRSALLVATGAVMVACVMPPADVLDSPRILAIQVEPPDLRPGTSHTLTALAYGIADDGLEWSACPVAWAPTDPVSCPVSDPLELGRGNHLTVTFPPEVRDLWLLVDAPEPSLPATRRVEASDLPTDNPAVEGIALAAAPGAALAPLAPGATVSLTVAYASGVDAERFVVSWYTTAGELTPARARGPEAVTLEAPEAPGPVRVFAVIRTLEGGVAWAEATLEVTP